MTSSGPTFVWGGGAVQRGVERLARHARLDLRVHVLVVDGHHLGHLRQIDADAAVGGEDVAFERAADAEGDDRHPVFAAQVNDLDHLGGGVGPHHAFGQRVGKMGFVMAVVGAHRLGGGKALAETVGEGSGEGVGQ